MRLFERSRPWIYLFALAALNIYLCHEAFVTESTGHFHSMHGSWIALARLAGLDRFAPHWWPYWGGGAPLEFTYAPGIPVAMAARRPSHSSAGIQQRQKPACRPQAALFSTWPWRV